MERLKTKRVCVISDIHSGSGVSPADKECRVNYDGNVIGLNPVQRRINRVWAEMCASEPYDAVVVCGDLCEGGNWKSQGAGLWTNSMDLQAEGAARLISRIPLKPGGVCHFIGGTPYHIGDNPGADQLVAQKLNAMGGIAKYHGIEFILNIDGQRIHFSHWSSGGFYEGTFLNREIVWSYIYKHNINGLMRAHLHHYHLDSDGHRFAVLLPGWKIADDYVKRKGFRYGRGQIGWVDLYVGHGKVDIQPHLYSVADKMPEAIV